MTALNLHRLMADDKGYLRELRVADTDLDTLRSAREEIRTTLRSAFNNWSEFVRRTELFEDTLLKANVEERLPAPKFKIQGSCAYHTVNDCQHAPQQQIDMDDGVYLPLSFVFVGGKTRPTIAAKAYFTLVERALEPLCIARGWKLNPTSPAKNTCVRVEIGHTLHVDLPLYAIRDSSFEELATASAQSDLQKAQIRESVELDQRVYDQLESAEIILAHRKHGWIESDPRKLERWFNTAVDLYGPVVRELSRALKGLRDAKWVTSDLGSICIMAAVVDVMPKLGQVDEKRFDMTLAAMTRALSDRMALPVDNPGFPGDAGKRLCVEWTPEFRTQVRQLFSEAAQRLDNAITGTVHKDLAVRYAREAFGDRVPNDPSLIELGSVATTVRQTPPQRQPEPMVPRTKSG